jgi:tRNA(adenine34) deaminase
MNAPMATPTPDETFMRRALELADVAAVSGEVPVGAVIVQDGHMIAMGYNQPIGSHDPTAHAEIVAMREAGKLLDNYRLEDTTLYVTLEPCPMCASAMVHARVRRVVFGAWDPKAGGAGSIVNIFTLPELNHRVDVFGGVLMEECGEKLSKFFRSRRT